ncbi:MULTISPECIES: LysR family transcriptional regulator [unclassified Acidisoma]|jgi:DNA-binding transcriptional LysR family regulator|uniref:LysR family transcriptional regulator n=1 Tax=unclassified Acidisoma TaxID=2634065 RepID=UPI00131BFA07|nr:MULTISPECIES: LysR family transcriptional regulator [unclassified Acidisoma]
MRSYSFDGLPHFLAVAELGSFAAAAQSLGVSPSAVSQAVRGLEQRLGARLFNRTTRSVALTEAGARYLERVSPALQDITAAEEEIGSAARRPQGKLRLNVLRAGHMIVLQPILRRFLDAYPEIDLEIVVEAGMVDVVREGFDAGIRFGDVVARDMIGVSVGPPLTAHILAAPDYLAARGVPKHPRDLLTHDCICFRHRPSGMIERWDFARGGETLSLTVTGRLVFNDSAVLVQSALDGLGIVYMINGYIERFLADGRLVRLLADWSPPLAGFKLYYPDRQRVPRKLRALIDFLRTDLAAETPATAAVLA